MSSTPKIVFDETIATLIEGHERGYVLYTQVDSELRERFPAAFNYSVSLPSIHNAGIDLISVEDFTAGLGEPAHLLNLGIRAMLVDIRTRQPVHYWLLPRSSIYKTGFVMGNSVGVIDSSYRGVLKAPVVRTSAFVASGFKAGERYFQIVAPDMGPILAVRAVGSLPETDRGEGGFGSTGK